MSTPLLSSRNTLRRLPVLLAAVTMSLGMFTGCSQTSRESRNAVNLYAIGNYPAAADSLKPDITKKDENFVLTNCQYGSAALAAGRPGDLDAAENAFLSAYEVINSVKTNDGGRTMGAALVFEGIKVWKGEPFERAMAHYYLGVISLIHNDYDTARAAFENSLFKVRDYAGKDDLEHYTEAESNFALGYFGKGLCNLRLGKTELAQASFAQAARIDPRLAPVIAQVLNPATNTLIFVDAGQGPRKAAKGWYNEESVFGPAPNEVGPILPITALVDGRPITAPNANYSTLDTLAMAQERRWQDIDTLKKAKAVIGTGMMAAGTGVTAYGANKHDKGTALAGIGLILAGAAVSASSQSDIRSWDMLPRTVYIIPASLPPGTHDISVGTGGSQSAVLQAVIKPQRPGIKSDNVFYFRIH